MKRIELLLLAMLLSVAHVESAAAYLDPGTGSILLQSILALVAGAAVTLKLYWGKLKGYFAHGKSDPAHPSDERD
jgi:hypothetical protein